MICVSKRADSQSVRYVKLSIHYHPHIREILGFYQIKSKDNPNSKPDPVSVQFFLAQSVLLTLFSKKKTRIITKIIGVT